MKLLMKICRNPSLEFAPKVRACKGAGQKGSLGVTSHAPGSVGGCEGMNLHTPKWAPTLGVEILMDSWIFQRAIAGVKSHWIDELLISLQKNSNLDV
jgi:hypothetical protein